MEENRIPKKVLNINLETKRLRGRPRNIWQDEVRENERLVGEKGCKESVHNRKEWKKLMRAARNRNLHMAIKRMKSKIKIWSLHHFGDSISCPHSKLLNSQFLCMVRQI